MSSTSTNKNAASGSNGQPPPSKKAKLDTAVAPAVASDIVAAADPINLLQGEIWMQILSFVGPGHFDFVAPVSKQFKEWYKASVDSILIPPLVFDDANNIGLGSLFLLTMGKRSAKYSDTFYRVAFSSEACANYWKESTFEDPRRLQDDQVCKAVAKRGKVEVFEWLQEQGYYCPLDLDTIRAAASGGQMDFIKYLRNKNCPWNEDTCTEAAENGHLEVLKYLHENGCPWDQSTPAMAAFGGHLECLVYAHEKGCEWLVTTCNWAAENGHLDCLKYALEKGCRWDELTCSGAAKNGQFECLKYAHDHGCEWNARTCTFAAGSGHLQCLKYALANGCPWDSWTCELAAKNGQLEVLKFLYEHDGHEEGGVWNERTVRFVRYYALREQHNDILDWLYEVFDWLDEVNHEENI